MTARVAVTLGRGAGLGVEALLSAQQERFAETIEDLSTPAADGDLVDLWRRESARAVRRFLDDALHPERTPPTVTQRTKLRLSARNQLAATVTAVKEGAAIANVELDVNGQRLVASITVEAARELGLQEGSRVTAIVKASDVILATEDS